MNHTIQYEDPVRPIYEYTAIAAWAVSGAAGATAALVAPFGSSALFWPFVATCAAMGAVRLRSAMRLARQQAAMEGSELTFIDFDELIQNLVLRWHLQVKFDVLVIHSIKLFLLL